MAYRIIVKGVVQGVGFRPFVYRIAKEKNLRGFVRNVGNSVEILVDGERKEMDGLIKIIKNEHPPLAEIFSINAKYSEDKKFDDFYILSSEGKGEGGSDIPPDVCVCDKCVMEIFEEKNRRYLYPFTVCTDCGPRFTIIEGLPYDREKTTMREFVMCSKCKEEYLEPTDRRFRAEPICCPQCGPKYALYEKKRKIAVSDNAIRKSGKILDEGRILAIKGVGGTHLAAKITDDEPILRIREILGRKEKPFAVMARNISAVKSIAYLNKKEEELLSSYQRPILLLRKKGTVSNYISPGLHNIGVMLPYSGIHYLLFYYSNEPAFLMTSANLPGEPMAIKDEEVLSLEADYSLIHDRRIQNRCDDSVIKLICGRPIFLRRSRGFVPRHIRISQGGANVIALGPELDVVACILKNDRCFLTQYIGNTTKPNTLEYLESAVYNLLKLVKIEEIDAVAVDMHPSFNTSRLGREIAERFDAVVVECQHHHAHIASLMAEKGIDRMVGIAVDGAGFGVDGTVWGGEILLVDPEGFKRTGHLLPQIMPGGDLATRFPARMVAGILYNKYPPDELKEILLKNVAKGFRSRDEVDLVLKQIEKRFNTPLTTSAGRVLDAISTLLGVCYERTYEGEPAMKLESLAYGGSDNLEIPVRITLQDGKYIFDTTAVIDSLLCLKEEYSLKDVAASAQRAIAYGLVDMALRTAKKEKIQSVGISGGVSYNEAIVRYIKKKVEESGLYFYIHEEVPCGDGGISLGQAAIATQKLRLMA
jgi:hydrogenase maturation protein HypF